MFLGSWAAWAVSAEDPIGSASEACGYLSLSCSTTHWKQTLFMMDDPVPVHTGDVVTGSVVLQRNPVWRRHMSVSLSWTVTSTLDPTSQRVRHLFVKSYVVDAGSQTTLGGN